MALGLNLGNMAKILKCAGNEDVVTLKSQEEGDKLTVMFESPNQVLYLHLHLSLFSSFFVPNLFRFFLFHVPPPPHLFGENRTAFRTSR